jgi:hypothetical protein
MNFEPVAWIQQEKERFGVHKRDNFFPVLEGSTQLMQAQSTGLGNKVHP